MALALIFRWPLEWVVLLGAGIAVAYTTFGGIKAVIWTDALQALVFAGGGIAALVFLFASIPGNAAADLAAAADAGKLNTFTWDWRPDNDKTFWLLMIWSTVQTMAALGTDQDLTQRMLTCPDLRRGQRSLLFNAFVGFPVVVLFLLIGALVYVFYQVNPPAPSGASGSMDRIFTHFIDTALPVGYGLKGLLVAGIFAAAMSSLDSALGALSSTAVTDFYQPYIRPRASEAHYLRVARVTTFVFGVILAAVALAFADSKQLLEDAFGWVGLIFGGMLGVFLLGVLTRTRGHDRVNIVAMLSSVAILAAIKFYQESRDTVYIAWPWWIVLGTAWTCAVGGCFRTASGMGKRKL
jgi:Na+/proline symporter